MSSITTIPLNRLTPSRSNVRRTDAKADIDALATSILAHGLLQNLVVSAADDERYEVVAGGRRLAALKRLVAKGDIARDWPVPCQIVAQSEGAESSLAENVHRIAMNVMDEVEAFAALVAAGATSEEVARRFGATVRHVDQRLALARLSPRILQAYRKGDVTLDVARAFCLGADHVSQERVFRQFAKPITQAYAVRAAFTQGRVLSTDRIARFVGAEAYETAGGAIVRDLFEPDVALFEDGELLRTLAQAKLDVAAAPFVKDGWGWISASLQAHIVHDGCVAERLQPSHVRLSKTDRAAVETLRAQIETLDDHLSGSDDDDPLWTTRDAAEDDLERLVAKGKRWDRKLIAHAGVALTIAHDGAMVTTTGLIRRNDLKTINALRNPRTDPAPDVAPRSDTTPPESHLPQALVQELTLARTRAIRAALASAPAVALALVVHTLSQQAFAHRTMPGVGVAARPFGCDDDEALIAARDACAQRANADVDAHWRDCLAAPLETLLSDLAVCIAGLIDVAHAGASPEDRRQQAAGDAIAAALRLDMSKHWRADADFWARAPKAFAVAALSHAPEIATLSEGARTDTLALHAKRKKADLATIAEQALRDTRWLPEVLITPDLPGALALTPEGEAAIADTAAA